MKSGSFYNYYVKTVARLRKAEKLFAKALENTGKAQAEIRRVQGLKFSLKPTEFLTEIPIAI